MKYSVEFESEAELSEFLRWRESKRKPFDVGAWEARRLHKCVFSTRVQHAFQQLEIQTIGELLETTDQMFLRLPGFGKKSLKELRAVLEYEKQEFQKSVDTAHGNMGISAPVGQVSPKIAP